MGSGLPVCLTRQYWLWLLSLILIRDFISLQSLEEPEAAFSLDLSQEAYSLKKKKKSLMIFVIIKEKFILRLEIFPDQSGSS